MLGKGISSVVLPRPTNLKDKILSNFSVLDSTTAVISKIQNIRHNKDHTRKRNIKVERRKPDRAIKSEARIWSGFYRSGSVIN